MWKKPSRLAFTSPHPQTDTVQIQGPLLKRGLPLSGQTDVCQGYSDICPLLKAPLFDLSMKPYRLYLRRCRPKMFVSAFQEVCHTQKLPACMEVLQHGPKKRKSPEKHVAISILGDYATRHPDSKTSQVCFVETWSPSGLGNQTSFVGQYSFVQPRNLRDGQKCS